MNIEQIASQVNTANQVAGEAREAAEQAAVSMEKAGAQFATLREGSTNPDLLEIVDRAEHIRTSLRGLVGEMVVLDEQATGYVAQVGGELGGGPAGGYTEVPNSSMPPMPIQQPIPTRRPAAPAPAATAPVQKPAAPAPAATAPAAPKAPTASAAENNKNNTQAATARFKQKVEADSKAAPANQAATDIARRIYDNVDNGNDESVVKDMALLARLRHSSPDAKRQYDRLVGDFTVRSSIQKIVRAGMVQYGKGPAPDFFYVLSSEILQDVSANGSKHYGPMLTGSVRRNLGQKLGAHYGVQTKSDAELAFLADCRALEMNRGNEKQPSLQQRVMDSWSKLTPEATQRLANVFRRVTGV